MAALTGIDAGAVSPSRLASDRPRHSFGEQLDRIRSAWERDGVADAPAVLEQYPDLAADKDAVLDLALEEYCFLAARGVAVEPEAFRERFPVFRHSIARLLSALRFLESHAESLGGGRATTAWPAPGDTVAHYRLIEEIGRGGLARVYLAREMTSDAQVVIKLSSVRDRAADESRILSGLDHPNVVRMLCSPPDPGTGLTPICMPDLGRASLHDALDELSARRGPGSADELLRRLRTISRSEPTHADRADPAPRHGSTADLITHWARQIARALAYLHDEVRIAHHDLKPSNVLLTPGGRAVLIDFNLAGEVHPADPRLGGTLPYMAPEQWRALASGRSAVGIDPPAADVFALGVMLYELYAGRHPLGPPLMPVDTAGAATCLLERFGRGVVPLAEAASGVDPAVAEVVMSCLAAEPTRRPTAASIERRLRPHRARGLFPPAVAFVGVCGVLLFGFLASPAVPTGGPVSPREQFERAVQLAREGDAAQSLPLLDRLASATASEDRELFASVLAARARVNAELGRSAEAVADARASVEIRPDPEVLAALSYWCRVDHEAAARHARDAIHHGTLAGPAGEYAVQVALNNLAYHESCLIQDTAGRASALHTISRELDSLLSRQDLHPRVGLAARYNRATLALTYWMTVEKTHASTWRERAVNDIDFVLADAGDNVGVILDAARLYAWWASRPPPGGSPGQARRDRERAAGRIVECRRRLHEAGNETSIRAFEGDPSIREFLPGEPPVVPRRGRLAGDNFHLVDPATIARPPAPA